MSRVEFEHALIIGKFRPPHEGHLYLIATALFHCRRVSVLVLGSSAERLSLRQRAGWLRDCFPTADGMRVTSEVDDVPIDYASDEIWSAHVEVMRRGLRRIAVEYGDDHPVDVVFSSEEYGAELARRFGASHVCLDRPRVLHPISGTAVRADPPAHWMRMPAPVRAGLALRVALIGAESTGTTTLTRDLCAALRDRGGAWARTAWVPEYGREYSMNLLAVARARRPDATPYDLEWHEADFTHIAEEQTHRENVAARDGGPVLLCDTDALATCVWHERYRGHRSASVEAIAAAMPARALYLLTDHHGVAFEDDGLRDGEHLREWMNERFAQVLDAGAVPWRLVSGSREERLAAALRHVDDAVRASWPISG